MRFNIYIIYYRKLILPLALGEQISSFSGGNCSALDCLPLPTLSIAKSVTTTRTKSTVYLCNMTRNHLRFCLIFFLVLLQAPELYLYFLPTTYIENDAYLLNLLKYIQISSMRKKIVQYTFVAYSTWLCFDSLRMM